MIITKEIINQSEVKAQFQLIFDRQLIVYNSFFKSGNVIRANGLLGILNHYAKILELNLAATLGRDDLEKFVKLTEIGTPLTAAIPENYTFTVSNFSTVNKCKLDTCQNDADSKVYCSVKCRVKFNNLKRSLKTLNKN